MTGKWRKPMTTWGGFTSTLCVWRATVIYWFWSAVSIMIGVAIQAFTGLSPEELEKELSDQDGL